MVYAAWKMPVVPLSGRGTNLAGIARAARCQGASLQPGAGGMCLHTILFDPGNPAAFLSPFRRRRFPHRRWRPDLAADQSRAGLPGELPDKTAEVGHCVHNLAMHPSRPGILFMQKHWDVMRSDNAGDSWHEVSGNLPSDFGFPIAVHAHEPNTVYVIRSKAIRNISTGWQLRVYRSRSGGMSGKP